MPTAVTIKPHNINLQESSCKTLRHGKAHSLIGLQSSLNYYFHLSFDIFTVIHLPNGFGARLGLAVISIINFIFLSSGILLKKSYKT